MLGINTPEFLILKVINKINVKFFCITILSVLPLFPPFSQRVLAFCFDKILYLFYTNYAIGFNPVSIDTDSFCERYMNSIKKGGNDSHMLGSLDSSRTYKKHVSNIE